MGSFGRFVVAVGGLLVAVGGGRPRPVVANQVCGWAVGTKPLKAKVVVALVVLVVVLVVFAEPGFPPGQLSCMHGNRMSEYTAACLAGNGSVCRVVCG